MVGLGHGGVGAALQPHRAGADLEVLVSANLGRWHLTRYDGTGLAGAPLHRPTRWAADAA